MKKFNMLFVLVIITSFISAMDKEKFRIILLKSTCSSGKTTLCKEFVKQNDDWEVVDEDEICMDMIVPVLKKHCPQEYALLGQYIAPENIFNAVNRREMNLCQLTQQRKLFLPDEIKDKKTAYIAPKEPCDYVVYTGVFTPQATAKDLKEKISK